MKLDQDSIQTGSATYCPEDNKLRLYVGRVPRAEYDALRAEGWTTTPKQSEAGKGEFAATWTPERRDTALAYGQGVIDDEDAGPAERAADRAERFSGYRDKREGEATGRADKYEAEPSAHGFQNAQRAERAASRHDRIAERAGDAWSKAEYWTRRTSGVISHALYKSTPGVRMGRIKELETALRRQEKTVKECNDRRQFWVDVSETKDADLQNKRAEILSGSYYSHGDKFKHPRTGETGSLWDMLREDAPDRITGAAAAALYLAEYPQPFTLGEWGEHYKLRLAYEEQMIEAEGGRAADVEMIAGGFIGSRQIQKVNKSAVTGRVVSVQVLGVSRCYADKHGKPYGVGNPPPLTLHTVNIERAGEDIYRPPTDAELAEFTAKRKAAKAAQPKKVTPPLVNPTDTDAERLQALWNERAKAEHCESHTRRYGKDYASEFKPSTVCRITQATYSQNSKGSYARAETKEICGSGIIKPEPRFYRYAEQDAEAKQRGPVVCQLRITSGDGSDYGAKRVIVLTDKPQKPLPAAVWETYTPAVESETVNA